MRKQEDEGTVKRKHRTWTAGLLLLSACTSILACDGETLRAKTQTGAAKTQTGAAKTQSGGSRWGADYFPNVPLTTHEGKQVHFFDDLIKDKVVVINFIYTTCPDSCPLETARLSEVQSILGDRVGKDVFMYSISIDPEHDTPEVLAQYVENYQIGPGWWFLTGTVADITLLRQKLGLFIAEIQKDGSKDHNLNCVIGNQATGQWMKTSPFENPYVLAGQIGGQLHNWKLPPRGGQDYEDAPKLRNVSKGESLFRTRCSACHALGPDDGVPRVGPNLLGVLERRERPWLARWLREPDTMLAEKDPIALGLYLAYKNVPMPNMRLEEREVDCLLEYIDAESHRLAAEPVSPAEDSAAGDAAPRPCCQKRDNLVLGTTENPAEDVAPSRAVSSVEPEERPAPEPALESPVPEQPEAGLSTLSLISIGLGLTLGLATAFTRRHSLQPS